MILPVSPWSERALWVIHVFRLESLRLKYGLWWFKGAMDVSSQLVAFDGEHKDLFKSAILLGTVALPMPGLSSDLTKFKNKTCGWRSFWCIFSAIESGQAVYDQVVKAVGCTPGSGSLQCLRKVDYKKLVYVLSCDPKNLIWCDAHPLSLFGSLVPHHRAALNTFPGIFSQTRYPSPFRSYVDGKFLTGSIQKLVKEGKGDRSNLSCFSIRTLFLTWFSSSLRHSCQDSYHHWCCWWCWNSGYVGRSRAHIWWTCCHRL